MIDIKYGQLFSVELLHKYTADKNCNDFTIVPSLSTQQLLKNYRIIAKQYGNTLYAGTDLDSQQLLLNLQKPLIAPNEGTRLTFFLFLNNPLFFNFTDIRKANNNGTIYYFSNRNNNVSNTKNFVTASLPGYVAGTYPYEDVVVDAGTVYQSISENNSANLTNSNWRKVDNNRYASAEDILSWIPSVSTFSLNPVTPLIDIKVNGYDGSGNYTQPVFSNTINNSANHSSFLLDLSQLEPGKYMLSINGTSPVPVYLNDELSNNRVFGVIDIFVESSLPTSYQVLNGNKELNTPVYSIYFLNRSTIWKYILRRTSIATITDTSGTYSFSTTIPPTTPTTVIQSQSPIPLSETPLKLELDSGQPTPPSADAQRLAKISLNPGSVFYSEIFLNY
ncbi:MAG: hypothetical protein ABI472_21500 [Ginsengibacter sp.]